MQRGREKKRKDFTSKDLSCFSLGSNELRHLAEEPGDLLRYVANDV